MKCDYCKKELKLSHFEHDGEVSVYDCTNCPISVSYYFHKKSDKKTKISFMVDRKNKFYIWTNNYIKNSSYIIDVGTALYSSLEKDPILLKFPKIMDITPENIIGKLSFYMVFL